MTFDALMTVFAYAGFASAAIMFVIYFYVRKNN